jgi:hypothetical protein
MKLHKLFLLAVALLAVASVAMAEEAAWFDMKGCAFCKNLTTDPELLKNMTWDHYDVTSGVMAVTVVAPAFQESYKKAMAAMEKVGADLQKGGAMVPMCGHCQAYGALMMSGAKFDYVQSKVGDIVLITSEKPETVAMIKKYGQRNREEMAKMEAAEKTTKN